MIDTQSSSFHSFNLSLLNDLWLLCSCCYSSWRTPDRVLKVSSAHRVETISINSTYHHHLFKADLLDEFLRKRIDTKLLNDLITELIQV